MQRLLTVCAFAISAALVPVEVTAEDKQPPQLTCETGPLLKEYGQTRWLVFACDDGHSLVIVSAE